MRRSFIATALTAALSFTAISAAPAAAEAPRSERPFAECTLTMQFNSRPLFTNAGIYASRPAAMTPDLYCQLGSGFYADIWNLTPFGSFGDGGEVDVRGGWQKQFGRVGVDVSAAWYNFRVDGLGVLNIANGRAKISYDFFDPKDLVVLQVYGIADYQHSFDFTPSTAFALAGGAYAGYKVTPAFEAGLGAEVWRYTAHWTPNPHATVFTVVPQVKYAWNSHLTLFAKAALTTGSVLDHGRGWKPSYMAGFSYRF